MISLRSRKFLNILLLLALATSVVSVSIALYAARRWPLVGDVALMRYVVLMLHAGFRPYSDIIDINWPGSYFFEASAMHIFGTGAHGLRLYDAFLCVGLVTCSIFLAESGWRSRLCGCIAGLTLTALHLKDGVEQAAQRDLVMAILALVAYVLFLRLPPRRSTVRILSFQLLVGASITIKPTLLPLALVPFLYLVLTGKSSKNEVIRTLKASSSLLVCPIAMLVWLGKFHAIKQFWEIVVLTQSSHHLIAAKSTVHLIGQAGGSITIYLLAAGIVWFALCKTVTAEDKLLVFGSLCGLGSFLIQGKGFPYQRYPLLAFALICCLRLFARAASSENKLSQLVGLGSICTIALWLIPSSAKAVIHFDAAAPFETSLAHDLLNRHAVSGEVQCMDTVGGCVATLNSLGLKQATGFLYDCYSYEGSKSIKSSYRAAFFKALSVSKPQYIVLTSQYCLEATGDLARIERWPEFSALLADRYAMDTEWKPETTIRWWSHPQLPPSYVILSRK